MTSLNHEHFGSHCCHERGSDPADGSPIEIYERPNNEFIAGFCCFVNFLDGKVEEVDVSLERAKVSTPIGTIRFLPREPSCGR